MKFRDGQWLPAEGVRSEYAEEIHTVTKSGDGKSLSLLCPTKKVLNRADTLNLSTLTLVSVISIAVYQS
jgi:alpha-D-xyloside xylohydrolase